MVQRSLETVGSFVGSGHLEWPLESQHRLGLWFKLLDYVAREQDGVLQFCCNFLYSKNDLDDMVDNFVRQYFGPFARDFRRIAQSNVWSHMGGDRVINDIPASDRVVSLDHNSAVYGEVISALESTIDAVRGSNEYATSDPDDHDQRTAELEAGSGIALRMADVQSSPWLDENRPAIKASNAYVERNGLPLARYRQF